MTLCDSIGNRMQFMYNRWHWPSWHYNYCHACFSCRSCYQMGQPVLLIQHHRILSYHPVHPNTRPHSKALVGLICKSKVRTFTFWKYNNASWFRNHSPLYILKQSDHTLLLLQRCYDTHNPILLKFVCISQFIRLSGRHALNAMTWVKVSVEKVKALISALVHLFWILVNIKVNR